ncbi:MAG: aspartate aminotransferase family protein [Solirubrobacteraceae bacterium]
MSNSMPGGDIAQLISTRAAEAMALNQRHLNPQLGRVLQTLGYDRRWVRGEGTYLIDADGERYLDMYAGYGVFALGRNHPYVKQQLHRLIDADPPSLPQLGTSLLAGVLAEQLIARAPAHLDAVFLTNSGTESVEGALKFARAATGRSRILFCSRAFHGLSYGALSANGNDEYRERFGPLLPGFERIPFGDLDALAVALGAGDVAALIVEPVQGKGVYVAPDGYLAAAQRLLHSAGALLIADEVQTGLGRTGKFLALEHWGLKPDIVTLSKALSGGFVPIGAVLASRAVFDATFDSLENSVVHSSTFGGGDLAAAAGLATLNVLDHDRLVERAAQLGGLLHELTRPLAQRFEIVREVRGLGLMWAIELGPPPGPLARRTWEAIERRQPGFFAQLVTVPLFHDHHILTQVAGHHLNVVKVLPALTIAEQDLRRFVRALEEVLGQAERHALRTYADVSLGLARRRALAR